jgi:hypothetical protein
MAGPLGGAVGRSSSGHHQSWRRRWQAPWAVLAAGPAAATTKFGDVNGGPPGGVRAEGPGAPTTNVKMSTVGPQEVVPIRDPRGVL